MSPSPSDGALKDPRFNRVSFPAGLLGADKVSGVTGAM